MGIESNNIPPLPAPTETDIAETATSTELTHDSDDTPRPGDEASHYSLPDDGTPVTIRTRGHKANKSQTSLLIEYFEGGKSGASGSGDVERKPSVRVRLTPSKRNKDHIQITESRGSRKASLTRRIPLGTPEADDALRGLQTLEHEDAESMRSYASATEESNVSRNPIDIEIDPSHRRRRRPASPLIPEADADSRHGSFQPPTNESEISAIPTDSFLDGSGPTNMTNRDMDPKGAKSPASRGGQFASGAAGAAAGAVLTDKMKNGKIRDRERVVLPKSGDKEKSRGDRKQRSGKSRAGSVSEKPGEGTRSPRRKSSRSHGDSAVSGADSSAVSSSMSQSHTSQKSADQQSSRSGASKTSINNPKLLETVEDAIRRLILPELSALKREHSRRETRRGSLTSSATSVSREDLSTHDRRRSSGRHRRDREARHEYGDSLYGGDDDSVDDASLREVEDDAPRNSYGGARSMAAGAAAAGLAAAALKSDSPSVDDRRQRRRRRADGTVRSRSLGREKYAEEYDDREEEPPPPPPMPLMSSELNPSELTRTSILSAESDRPHSAMDERTPVQDVPRGSMDSGTRTPTRDAPNLRDSLGTKHANISSGDLRELPRGRAGDYESDYMPAGIAPPPMHNDDYEDEDYDDTSRGFQAGDDYDEPEDGLAADYYNTQDVPPPLKYVPYHPERRGLSPIYSVSGYTEGDSEAGPRRDSRTTNGSLSPDKNRGGMHSPSSIPSNVMARGFEDRGYDERSLRSSGLAEDFKNNGYIDGSDLERVDSDHVIRGVAANPRLIDIPAGVESNVASLVDGSMLDQSVLTGASSRSYNDYDNNTSNNRDSMASYGDHSRGHGYAGDESPDKRSYRSQQDYMEEPEGTRTPTSSRHSPSRDFAGEYDLDEYGRKVAPTQYQQSPSASRQSPTASEKAIAMGAVGAAAAALKAAKDRSSQPNAEGEYEPAGVFRNKSFKERTMEGREPANTPAHSIDRLDYFEDGNNPKMGVSAMPATHDPMPEIGYMDDDALTNPSLHREQMNQTPRAEDNWSIPDDGQARQMDAYDYPEQQSKGHGAGYLAAAGAGAAAAAAAAAMARSGDGSQEQDDEWQRTSADRKRDTLITNPYENASPVANPDLLTPRGLEPDGFGGGYAAASPSNQKNLDEGYISQGPVQSPNIQPPGKSTLPYAEPGLDDDPFYEGKSHNRQLSGMSQGMASPMFDAATGTGIDRIESKDIVALMQHLMVRDAQRSARDTEILVTLVRQAAEMRNSFEEMKQLLANTEDVVIKEVQENTEETVKNVIGGPRPFPGSAPRSAKAMSATQSQREGTPTDEQPKKNNLLRRAFLKSFGAKDTNDLSRIEDMLNTLLTEVDTLKAQTSRPMGSATQGRSYDNIQPEVPFEQDRGYEPEGHAGTSTASHASRSGQLSLAQSRGPSSKPGFDRKFSDHRISTVPEDEEDDYGPEGDYPHEQQGFLTPRPADTRDFQRGGSAPLGTPPQPHSGPSMSLSNENTPKTDKSKKHKSKGSSSWLPKISRWSESTATSVSKAFRGSGMSSKRGNEGEFLQRPLSRSGSDLDQFNEQDPRMSYENDPYGDDHLHSGFSQTNLPSAGQRTENVPPPPATYMTPEDPKYKAHRNSINLQHPQPRPGQSFKVALESQAYDYDTPMSPKSADWAGSATSLNRLPPQANNRYSGGSAATGGGSGYWGSSPNAGPPRPPKEPIDDGSRTPTKTQRVSQLHKGSPNFYQSFEESGYATGPGTQASNYAGSPKLENRNLSGALGVPTRRPSGPRAMTPKSAEEEAAREDRRRKRDTFGTVASNETDTF